LIAIVLGFVLCITLAVVYGEFCTSGNSELRDESEIALEKMQVMKTSFSCKSLSDSESSGQSVIPISTFENSYTRNLHFFPKRSGEIHIGQSRKNMSGISLSPTHQKSSWDCFFETQSTLASSKQMNKISVNNFESLQDWTDLYATQIELSQQELNADKWREEDVPLENSSGSEDSTSLENLSPENFRQKGEVLLSYHSKGRLRFTIVPVDTQLDDIAAWLNKGSKYPIPISLHNHPKIMEIKSHQNCSKKTLSEIFGGDLNPEKEGITIFIGPVEGKISFKMSKCDLTLLRRATRNGKASTIDLIHSVS